MPGSAEDTGSRIDTNPHLLVLLVLVDDTNHKQNKEVKYIYYVKPCIVLRRKNNRKRGQKVV